MFLEEVFVTGHEITEERLMPLVTIYVNCCNHYL